MSREIVIDKTGYPTAQEINIIRAWLVARGVSPQEAAQIATDSINRLGITDNMRVKASQL